MATKFITVSIEIMHDKNLTPNQKFILAEIMRISTLEIQCTASNKHFSELIGMTAQGVSNAISDLLKKGYIELDTYSDKETFELLNTKNSSVGCVFCAYDGIAIDHHHYPIRATNGGTETIRLCANCHREFHNLADYRGNGISVVWNKVGQTQTEYRELLLEVQDDK